MLRLVLGLRMVSARWVYGAGLVNVPPGSCNSLPLWVPASTLPSKRVAVTDDKGHYGPWWRGASQSLILTFGCIFPIAHWSQKRSGKSFSP